MPVKCICAHCGGEYSLPPSQAAMSRFCSVDCYRAHKVPKETRTITCERCGKRFTAKQDHGVWPRFCCRKCFCGDGPKPKNKICPVCGKEFWATWSAHHTEDGLRTHCSRACANKALKTGETRICLQCGKEYYLGVQQRISAYKEGCCSAECQHEYYIKDKSHSWKGGSFISAASGEKFVWKPGETKGRRYIGEHRVIASEHVGRMLTRDEYVIRIDHNPTNNSPDNLFICKTNKDFCAIRDCKKPWPTKSNLDTYK